MFKTLDDFFEVYEKESRVTQNVFDNIGDSSASQEVCEGHRGVQEVHLAAAIAIGSP